MNYMKWIKLIIGAFLACVIADLLELQYYAATGIITLLTIQDTRKETFVITLKRIVIFVIMTVLSAIVFPITGFCLIGFGIILIPYLFLCLWLKMPEAIAPIAVLCTHYMGSESCSWDMIQNEFLILVIGAGIGILCNAFMPDNRKKLLKFQKQTDEKIIGILHRMSINLLKEDKSEYTGSCFAELEEVLGSLKKEAMTYMANHVTDPDDYFLQYMNMRTRQCGRLRELYGSIMRIRLVVEEARPISQFLEKIANEFSEENDVESLLLELEQLTASYKTSELPSSREEFESRAILFEMLSNIKTFLQIKREFVMVQHN